MMLLAAGKGGGGGARSNVESSLSKVELNAAPFSQVKLS
jgi:hypothetical protein